MKQLPTVKLPEYNIKLSDDKSIKIRPFVAKEEKILLMAIESESDNKKVYESILSIIQSCILTKGIDVRKLAPIDIEIILLEIRKNSVSEVVETTFDSRKMFNCGLEICSEQIPKKFSLNTVEIKNKENISKVIRLDDKVSVRLKHKMLSSEEVSGSKIETLYNSITACIDVISDDENVINISDFTFKQLSNWVENSFNKNHIKEALDFIQNSPHLYANVNVKCPICNQEKDIELKGILSFFTL